MRHFLFILSFPPHFPYTSMQISVNQRESVSKDAEIFNYSYKKCFLPSRSKGELQPADSTTIRNLCSRMMRREFSRMI